MRQLKLAVPLVLFAANLFAQGIPTTITVRAISRDAKVIGDGVGSARITIRDLSTGKVLASGIQRGGTGDTKRIMQEPRERGAVVYGTEGAAFYRAIVLLDRPTRVEIAAEGPLKYPQAIQRTSTTLLLVPGQDLTGEGVLLEIPGLIVDVTPLPAAAAGQTMPVRAKVTMTCGCPTEPGGLWDADQIHITATVLRGNRVVAEVPLSYAGQSSTFEGLLPGLKPGSYRIEVLATDGRTGNSGRALQRWTVARGRR